MSCAILSALSPSAAPAAAVLRLTEHGVLINSGASLSSLALSRSVFGSNCVSRPGKGVGDVKFGLGDARNKTVSRRSSFDSSISMGTTSSSRNSSKSFSKSDKSSMTPAPMDVSSDHEDFKSVKDSEWKQRLTKEQFDVARKKGTERPFTGEYWKTKTEGTYQCICCNTPLFDSKTKYDSGTGWPSYWSTIGDNVKSETDRSIPFMPRTEVLCRKCDAHLGHVFDDGPRPTGQRFCINSASLKLKPSEK